MRTRRPYWPRPTSRPACRWSDAPRALAGSTDLYSPSLTAIEEYISLLDRLRSLLVAAAGGPPRTEVRRDHNLTSAVSLMTRCLVRRVPGFDLEWSAGAKSGLLPPAEMEELYIQVSPYRQVFNVLEIKNAGMFAVLNIDLLTTAYIIT